MIHPILELESIVKAAFVTQGVDPKWGSVDVSRRPDLAQYQINGCMGAAKEAGANPRQLADAIVKELESNSMLAEISVAGPGFINLTLNDDVLSQWVQHMSTDIRLGIAEKQESETIILDFGGPNLAKAMHVGHVRSLIIGDCLQRLLRFTGETVYSDIHMGDWGLPMGMLILGVKEKLGGDSPYFNENYTGEYPAESPVTIEDLETLYPEMATKAKEDEAFRDEVRNATAELQAGRAGYRALWQHFRNLSMNTLKKELGRLGVEFDLWLGESSVNDIIPMMIDDLKTKDLPKEDQGAVVIHLNRESDNPEMPPLILVKTDGGYTYGTTDLATIAARRSEINPDHILYVVDKRQQTHFTQVFRSAQFADYGAENDFEFVGFGTINGKDGRPYKTRDGGVMRLSMLLDEAHETALKRINEAQIAQDMDTAEREKIAEYIGIAAIKFADLMNHRSSDYNFDLERFTTFEGKTGPYLQYAGVRIRSLLNKANAQGVEVGEILPPSDPAERELMLHLQRNLFAVQEAAEKRAPNLLCEYVYTLAQCFSRFYEACHILSETNIKLRASRLALAQLTLRQLEHTMTLLGIIIPEKM